MDADTRTVGMPGQGSGAPSWAAGIAGVDERVVGAMRGELGERAASIKSAAPVGPDAVVWHVRDMRRGERCSLFEVTTRTFETVGWAISSHGRWSWSLAGAGAQYFAFLGADWATLEGTWAPARAAHGRGALYGCGGMLATIEAREHSRFFSIEVPVAWRVRWADGAGGVLRRGSGLRRWWSYFEADLSFDVHVEPHDKPGQVAAAVGRWARGRASAGEHRLLVQNGKGVGVWAEVLGIALYAQLLLYGRTEGDVGG